MNSLYMRRFFLFLIILLLLSGSACARIFHKSPEKQLFGKTHVKKKEPKVREPRKVLKAKKKQEANDRRLKKAYDKSVKQSQQRTVDIQTPEVQERMKQNKKEYVMRDKDKKKKVKEGSKRAGKKYN
jgi:cytochrome c biogenesis protein ResB